MFSVSSFARSLCLHLRAHERGGPGRPARQQSHPQTQPGSLSHLRAESCVLRKNGRFSRGRNTLLCLSHWVFGIWYGNHCFLIQRMRGWALGGWQISV